MNASALGSRTWMRGVIALAAVSLTVGPGARPTRAREPVSAPVTRLTEGLVLEREAVVGETHRYSIELLAGQYVHLPVEQRGVDVSLTVTGPDGAVLMEGDMLCAEIGPEPVAFKLPSLEVGRRWEVLLDSAEPGVAGRGHRGGSRYDLIARSSALLRQVHR